MGKGGGSSNRQVSPSNTSVQLRWIKCSGVIARARVIVNNLIKVIGRYRCGENGGAEGANLRRSLQPGGGVRRARPRENGGRAVVVLGGRAGASVRSVMPVQEASRRRVQF